MPGRLVAVLAGVEAWLMAPVVVGVAEDNGVLCPDEVLALDEAGVAQGVLELSAGGAGVPDVEGGGVLGHGDRGLERAGDQLVQVVVALVVALDDGEVSRAGLVADAV